MLYCGDSSSRWNRQNWHWNLFAIFYVFVHLFITYSVFANIEIGSVQQRLNYSAASFSFLSSQKGIDHLKSKTAKLAKTVIQENWWVLRKFVVWFFKIFSQRKTFCCGLWSSQHCSMIWGILLPVCPCELCLLFVL